jgi:hypothetical protein
MSVREIPANVAQTPATLTAVTVGLALVLLAPLATTPLTTVLGLASALAVGGTVFYGLSRAILARYSSSSAISEKPSSVATQADHNEELTFDVAASLHDIKQDLAALLESIEEDRVRNLRDIIVYQGQNIDVLDLTRKSMNELSLINTTLFSLDPLNVALSKYATPKEGSSQRSWARRLREARAAFRLGPPYFHDVAMPGEEIQISFYETLYGKATPRVPERDKP